MQVAMATFTPPRASRVMVGSSSTRLDFTMRTVRTQCSIYHLLPFTPATIITTSRGTRQNSGHTA